MISKNFFNHFEEECYTEILALLEDIQYQERSRFILL